MLIGTEIYESFQVDNKISHVTILDHMGGVDLNGCCPVLDRLQAQACNRKITVESEYIFNQQVRHQYPNFDFKFSLIEHDRILSTLQSCTIHSELTFKNFLCSFNGFPHVSRKLLVSILNKYKLFNQQYCSKNFKFTSDVVDGHVQDYVGEHERFFNKFFTNSEEFNQMVINFDYSQPYNDKKNLGNLESKITDSFVHLVSDTMATSYHPFYGEKFLFSVVTKGLFVAYGNPGWHSALETHYGFRPYRKLFDYRFDSIVNPVERLVELVTMLSKFSTLTSDEWRDLYLLEQDTIEYNYNHYFSRDYVRCLEKAANE
jgi:hypothetical protein